MSYQHYTEYTKKQLAEAIKIAKANNCPITVSKFGTHTSIVINNLPIGCGFGYVGMSTPKSHRKHQQIDRAFSGNYKWEGSNYHYTRFYYGIPNTTESIEKAKKLGATVTKVSDKVFMGHYNKDIQVTFVVKKLCAKE